MYKHEKTVLSWWLTHESDALQSQLTPEHFTDPRLRKVASVMKTRGWNQGHLMAVCPPELVSELVGAYVIPGQVPKAERALMQNFAVKAAEVACVEFQRSVRMDSGRNLEAIHRLVRSLHEAESMGPVMSRSHAVVAADVMRSWLEGVQSDDGPATLPFPWRCLQEHTGGLPLGKLVLIGGRSSEHKTTLARSIGAHMARDGHRVVFWTLEDSDEDVCGRTIADESRILTTKALADRRSPRPHGKITEDDLSEILDVAKRQIEGPIGSNLLYIDVANPRLSSVLSQIKAEAARGAVAFFGDFLQLCRPDSPKQAATNDWWRDAVAAFAGLAKSLNILICWTSQIEKHATKESVHENRVPRGVEMPFGAVIRQGAYGCLMVGMSGANRGQAADLNGEFSRGASKPAPAPPARPTLTVEVDKWKSAGNVDQCGDDARFIFDVDPEHDRLTERSGK